MLLVPVLVVCRVPLRSVALRGAPVVSMQLEAGGGSSNSITELLQQLRSLEEETVETPAPVQRLASGDAPATVSPLGLDAVRARARTLLADSSLPPEERQLRLANLATDALEAGRPRSAWLTYELAEKRVRKWRNTKPLKISRALLRAGLLSLIAMRDQTAYEALLASAQSQLDVDLAAEPELLSAAMASCCAVDWHQHASAINATLHDEGLQPSTDALNAAMDARLRRLDANGAFDVFIRLRRHGPPPNRKSHELAACAAVARKGTWNGLRNLMRRRGAMEFKPKTHPEARALRGVPGRAASPAVKPAVSALIALCT